jgi:hypothetical protein
MSETDAFINQVTIDCLLNKTQYSKYINNITNKNINKKDRRFYRRRILSLTKDLLYKEENEVIIPLDIKYMLDNYINTCINYFKTLDKNDIIQEEYKEYENKMQNDDGNDSGNINENELTEQLEFLKDENNKLLMRSINISKPSLDNFITIKMTRPPNKLIVPQQKEINLKDPILKNKGISKNKNNTIIYDAKQTNTEIKENKTQEENK